jgi:hypothetical protein
MALIVETHWDVTTSPVGGADGATAAVPSTMSDPIPPSITLVKEARFDRGSLLSGQGTVHFSGANAEYLVKDFTANDDVFVDMLVWFDEFDVPSSGTTDQRILAIRGNSTTYANIVVVINPQGEAFFSVRNGNNAPLVIESDPDYQLAVNTLYRIGLYQDKVNGNITAYWTKGNSRFQTGKTYAFSGQAIGAQASQIVFGATNPVEFTGKVDAVRVFDSSTLPNPHTRRFSAPVGTILDVRFEDLWPGDILKLDPGNYDGWVISDEVVCQAIPGNPIVIEGDENYGTWIAGPSAHCRIKNAHSWVWRYINADGSEFEDQLPENLVIVRGNDWTWEKSEFRYSMNNFKALFSVDGDGVIDSLRPESPGEEGTLNAISHGWRISDCWMHSNEGVNWNFNTIPGVDGNSSYQDHCIYITDSMDGTIERCVLTDTPNGRAVKVGRTSVRNQLPFNTMIRDCTFVYNWGEGNSKVSYTASNNVYEYCVIVGPQKKSDQYSIGYHNFSGSNNVVRNCRTWLSLGSVHPDLDGLPDDDGLFDGPDNVHGDPVLNNRFEPLALTTGSPPNTTFTHGHLRGKASYLDWDGPPTAFRRTARFRRLRR